jgi:hypothetical protein
MYLSNLGLRPTGFEAGEFMEVTRMVDDGFPMLRARDEGDEPTATPLEADARRNDLTVEPDPGRSPRLVGCPTARNQRKEGSS